MNENSYSQSDDYEFFLDRIESLMERCPGRFVVIHNRGLVREFSTLTEAVHFGREQYSMGRFIAQEVRNDGPTTISYSLMI